MGERLSRPRNTPPAPRQVLELLERIYDSLPAAGSAGWSAAVGDVRGVLRSILDADPLTDRIPLRLRIISANGTLAQLAAERAGEVDTAEQARAEAAADA